MNDEQKRATVASMKKAMQYGEVEYEAGLELRKITGWFGITDLAPGGPPASIFGPLNQGSARSIAVSVCVIQDIDTPMNDQEIRTIPWQRVVEMRAAPRMN